MGDAPGGTPFEVTTRSSPQGALVTASGELDMATAEQFTSTLLDALSDGGAVTLDAADLTFLDSSGLRALDEVHRAALRTGTTFAIAPDFRPAVRRTLELSGMLTVLPVLPEERGNR
jgi:anti-sigma B factor antagonist